MRNVILTAFAAASLGVLALGSNAQAAPAAAGIGSSQQEIADSLLLQVRGCHRSSQFHYSEYYGRRIWHRHRGRSCRADRTDPPGRDYHDYRDSRHHSTRESRYEDRHSSRYSRRTGCVRIGPVTVCD